MTKSTNTISVVIPCYNDGQYITETIEKLKQQTVQPIEIIIVNDGSTDNYTLSVLDKLATDPLIQVLHKENGRMSAARNYGVQYAKGDFIAALDADDYFDNHFFEKAIKVFKSEERIAVVTSYIKFFGNTHGHSKPRGGNAYNFLFSNQCPACAMVRKSVWDQIGGYDEQMKLGYEDWEFYIRITQLGFNVHLIPEYLLYYRQTDKSTLKNQTHPNRKQLIEYILSKHKDWYIKCLADLVNEKQVIYTESRIAYGTIWKLLKNRLTRKYK
jgi:glycosyltransferase involved in cell wall biosynthesis